MVVVSFRDPDRFTEDSNNSPSLLVYTLVAVNFCVYLQP